MPGGGGSAQRHPFEGGAGMSDKNPASARLRKRSRIAPQIPVREPFQRPQRDRLAQVSISPRLR